MEIFLLFISLSLLSVRITKNFQIQGVVAHYLAKVAIVSEFAERYQSRHHYITNLPDDVMS